VAPAIDRLAGEIAAADPTRWTNLIHDRIEGLVRRRIVAPIEAAHIQAAVMDELVEGGP
jgi:hypothetical protein